VEDLLIGDQGVDLDGVGLPAALGLDETEGDAPSGRFRGTALAERVSAEALYSLLRQEVSQVVLQAGAQSRLRQAARRLM
jgi:hypothetical protein